MTQSDEKSSSHQGLAPNIAAMYALSGTQTTPAPWQKTVKRDDVVIGEVNVENVHSCTMYDSYRFEHQRAKQQEQNSPWNLKAYRTRDYNLLETADTFLWPKKPFGLRFSSHTLFSPDSLHKLPRSWKRGRVAIHGSSHCRTRLFFKATRIMPSISGLHAVS